MKNADTPAMPVFPETPNGHASAWLGLTKREHIAAMAMQGILANPYWLEHGAFNPGSVIASAVEYAYALIAELDRTKGVV